jgi:hypothetical protein
LNVPDAELRGRKHPDVEGDLDQLQPEPREHASRLMYRGTAPRGCPVQVAPDVVGHGALPEVAYTCHASAWYFCIS